MKKNTSIFQLELWLFFLEKCAMLGFIQLRKENWIKWKMSLFLEEEEYHWLIEKLDKILVNANGHSFAIHKAMIRLLWKRITHFYRKIFLKRKILQKLCQKKQKKKLRWLIRFKMLKKNLQILKKSMFMKSMIKLHHTFHILDINHGLKLNNFLIVCPLDP